MGAIKSMNLPKLVKDDIPLFEGLFGDLFPGVDLVDSVDTVIKKAITQELKKGGYLPSEFSVGKSIQVYDTLSTRHGNMLVGHSLGGKTLSWKIL
jgi:dynein heavy chain